MIHSYLLPTKEFVLFFSLQRRKRYLQAENNVNLPVVGDGFYSDLGTTTVQRDCPLYNNRRSSSVEKGTRILLGLCCWLNA